MSTTTTTFAQFARENRHLLPNPSNSEFSLSRVYQAYLSCRRTKRNKASALAFEFDQEENLPGLSNALWERRYRPTTSICFYTRKPKYREIFAADFRDRIVHHLIYNAISPTWESIFIHHSYACRPCKGTHAATRALQKFLRQITTNGNRRAFYLKIDIRNFFMAIDRRILFEMLAKKCHNPALLWLLEIVVFHDPTKDYKMMDREHLRFSLPPHKSLFNVAPDCGLPIGNLTSQFFANVYLNALDQFVKHELKCRYYLRYVDDAVLLDADVRKLMLWKDAVADFAYQKLRLRLNEKATQIAPVAGGVDFAGFIIRHDYKLVRRRVVGNLKEKLRKIESELVYRGTDCTIYRFHDETLARCQATVNSYFGHFKHANTHRLIAKIWRDFPFLACFFILSSHKISRIDTPLRKQQTLRQQVRWLQKQLKGYLCLIEVGCYYEAFGKQAEILAQALGLQLAQNWRGFVGMSGCGFPRRLLPKMLTSLNKQCVPVVVVRQTGRELYYTKERMPYCVIEYPNFKHDQRGDRWRVAGKNSVL